MFYNNIATIASPTGFAAYIVIRDGGHGDWAAYWLPLIADSQSGSLVKLYRAELETFGITDLVKANYPHLTYRA